MGSVFSFFSGTAEAAEHAPDDHSGVTSFHSSERWQLHFNSLKDTSQLMVVDFAASWCGPCKIMEPAVHAMASKFANVNFSKIDVDEVPAVAREYRVEAMPTFLLLKNGKEVDRVVGALKDELERKIARHM